MKHCCEGAANLQRGAETVGGKLFLTNQRLFFQSHAFNLQAGVTEIPLADIRGTEFAWTKFLGVIPIFPNTLSVVTKNGHQYDFVLFGRKQWAEQINAAIHAKK